MESNGHRHYEDDLWGAPRGRDEQNRFEGIEARIPPGVKRILDCGCGDGALGHRLMDKYTVTGCDLAAAPLSHCRFETFQSSLVEITAEDRNFDLVISSEVLEHMMPGDYEKACRELERVANEWILVTVPNREDLDYARQQCPHCGTIFHDAWHVRSIDEDLLARSFRDFVPKEWFRVGHKQRLDVILRTRLRNRILGYPRLKPNRQCPLCSQFGSSSGRHENPAATRVEAPQDGVYRMLRRFALRVLPGRERWLGCLLQRR